MRVPGMYLRTRDISPHRTIDMTFLVTNRQIWRKSFKCSESIALASSEKNRVVRVDSRQEVSDAQRISSIRSLPLIISPGRQP